MVDLKSAMFPDEEILGIAFGDWLSFRKPRHPNANAMRTGVLMNPEEAKPIMQGWEFYDSALKCYSIYAWTQRRVLFVSEYDMSTTISSCPRDPCAMIPRVYGSNCSRYSRDMFLESDEDSDDAEYEKEDSDSDDSDNSEKEKDREREALDAYNDLKDYLNHEGSQKDEKREPVFSPHIVAIVFGNRMDSGPLLSRMASHDNGRRPYTCYSSRWGKSIGVPNDLKGVILSEEQARPHMKGWTYFSDYGAGEKCFATLVWTQSHVIWAVQNDEMTTLRSAPRNPCHTVPATSFA